MPLTFKVDRNLRDANLLDVPCVDVAWIIELIRNRLQEVKLRRKLVQSYLVRDRKRSVVWRYLRRKIIAKKCTPYVFSLENKSRNKIFRAEESLIEGASDELSLSP